MGSVLKCREEYTCKWGQNARVMILKILSGLLILGTTVMSIRHGWGGLTGNARPADIALMTKIGMGKSVRFGLDALTVLVGVLVLFPRTFFVGNLLGAVLFVVIIAFALNSGNIRAALIEVPFLLIPLVLLWLGHPFSR